MSYALRNRAKNTPARDVAGYLTSTTGKPGHASTNVSFKIT